MEDKDNNIYEQIDSCNTEYKENIEENNKGNNIGIVESPYENTIEPKKKKKHKWISTIIALGVFVGIVVVGGCVLQRILIKNVSPNPFEGWTVKAAELDGIISDSKHVRNNLACVFIQEDNQITKKEAATYLKSYLKNFDVVLTEIDDMDNPNYICKVQFCNPITGEDLKTFCSYFEKEASPVSVYYDEDFDCSSKTKAPEYITFVLKEYANDEFYTPYITYGEVSETTNSDDLMIFVPSEACSKTTFYYNCGLMEDSNDVMHYSYEYYTSLLNDINTIQPLTCNKQEFLSDTDITIMEVETKDGSYYFIINASQSDDEGISLSIGQAVFAEDIVMTER